MAPSYHQIAFIVSGIQLYTQWNGNPNIDIFKDGELSDFRMCLDSEMKCLQRAWQCTSYGFATHRMVWQHGSNGFATRIEHLCNTSNGLATWIKYLCNTHRMVCQRGSNTYATRIKWFGNVDRILLQHTLNNSAPEKNLRAHSQSSKYIAHAHCMYVTTS